MALTHRAREDLAVAVMQLMVTVQEPVPSLAIPRHPTVRVRKSRAANYRAEWAVEFATVLHRWVATAVAAETCPTRAEVLC